MGLSEPPTAVQGRIFGSKGIWVLHPHDQHIAKAHSPKIWIRPSQQKIQLVRSHNEKELAKVHRSHFIFDLVQPSRTTVSTRLNRLALLNLSHNGVPTEVFARLMEDGLNREIAPLTQWQGPNAMNLLWHAVNKSTGASSQRLQQFISGAQRALGLSRKQDADEDADEDDAGSLTDSLSARCNASGKPLSIGDLVLSLIGAGFHPMKEQFLFGELKQLIDMIINGQIKKNHIPVPCSADAFIVPGDDLSSVVC